MLKILFISLLSMNLFSQELPISSVKNINLEGSKMEPSGIAIDNKGNILSVSDNGYIIVNGLPIRVKKKKDYEGITVSNDNRVFLVEEGKDRIISLDKKFKIKDKIKIDRKFKGDKVTSKKGNGFEALTFYKRIGEVDHFIVANQSKKFKGKDKSAVLFVDSTGKINKYIPLKIKDISGLHYKDGIIYLLSDKEQKLFLFDEEMNLLRSYNTPYEDLEGVFIDSLNLYFAQDTGKLFKIKLNHEL
jgi:uncharacterized protein YjiK